MNSISAATSVRPEKTDRELLEEAAMAAGLECDGESHGELVWFDAERGRMLGRWNPLEDDGDALRLAVKLGLNIHHGSAYVSALNPTAEVGVMISDTGALAATRRAIVRAAAEIGRGDTAGAAGDHNG